MNLLFVGFDFDCISEDIIALERERRRERREEERRRRKREEGRRKGEGRKEDSDGDVGIDGG